MSLTDKEQQLRFGFIEFAMSTNALQFGNFTLKSGRQSPYFFNAGQFNHGTALAKLGEYYAKTLEQHQIKFDILFGPAYKGIPLVSATTIAYHHLFQKTIPYCFNRKEAKKHGEGGQLVGQALKGDVVIIDDVITAGTAFREAMELMQHTPAKVSGVIIALDRQERGTGSYSAIDEIKLHYKIPVVSIITLADLIRYLETKTDMQECVASMKQHQQKVAPLERI